jgi:hypothetical protein
MAPRSWVRNLLARPTSPIRRASFRLELLEDRTTPSGGLELEPNGTAATANPMPVRDPISIMSAAINPGDNDFFSFSGTAGDRVWVIADTASVQINGQNGAVDGQ